MEMIIWLVAMVAIFYFLLIRPNQKRQKETQAMQDSLQVGNKVVTIGGLHGVVEAVEEKTVIIGSPDGTKLTFDRFAIRSIEKDDASTEG